MITIDELLDSFFKNKTYNELLLIKWVVTDMIDVELIKQFTNVRHYINQCYNKPNDIEIRMKALDELLDGFGVESIEMENVYVNHYWQNCIALYVNMGDSYLPTIIYDTAENEFILTTYADFIEKNEKRVDK